MNNNVDPRKMALLQEFQKMAKNTPQSDLLPLVLAISKKAQSLGMSFSPDEMQTIIGSMKKDMSPSESSQVDMVMNMMNLSRHD